MADKSKAERLAESTDMEPVHGTVDVDIPIATLWDCFRNARWWPRWNPCMFYGWNRDLQLGKQLIWCFEPIKPWLLYKMPAIAKIVELEEQRKVTWEVAALPGFYARHTYSLEDLGNGRTRFGSWEKAMGWNFRLCKRFWVTHFEFVKDQSLHGARKLQEVFQLSGELQGDSLAPKSYSGFFAGLTSVILIIIAAVVWL